MRVLFETALGLALALAIVFLVIVSVQRSAPHRHLPDRFELADLTFVLVVVSPLGAALVTCGLIFLFGVFALVLTSIGWLANYDLLAGTKAIFFEYTPSFVQAIRSWQVLIAIYVMSYIALLANGIRVLIQHH